MIFYIYNKSIFGTYTQLVTTYRSLLLSSRNGLFVDTAWSRVADKKGTITVETSSRISVMFSVSLTHSSLQARGR